MEKENKINWYKDRIVLNVLASDLDNAKEVYEAANKHVVVGILSKNFNTFEAAEKEMSLWAKALDNNISIGLGAGDPKQSNMVAELTKKLHPNHANQVFTGVGLTRDHFNDRTTFINCLISPTGTVGMVKINTGPNSSLEKDAIVPVETAIEMTKDLGGDSLKFFNMNGLEHLEEFKAVANACAKHDFAIEPTGGITLENFEPILKVAIDANVKKIIPHVYSSIVDKKTGKTRIEDIYKLMEIIQRY